MKAEETKFLKFLTGPKQLIIPIYQRAYSWTKKECIQLWKDIIKAGKDPNISGHFVGAIVYIEKGLYQASGLPKLLVIDGQQRLTTLTLLISAIRNFVEENNIECEINPDRLTAYYLLNKEEYGENKYKLVLTKKDKLALFSVIGKRDISDDYSNIKNNFSFFKDQISKENFTELYNGIGKLLMIDVSLDRTNDNPQLIFESLNSTGLELTQADLIRNYILMGLDRPKQEELYNNYWYPMETNFGQSENSELFDRFIRDYLTIKIGRIPKLKEIYSEFKLFSSKNGNIEKIVQDIYKLSKYYVNIALNKESDIDLKIAFTDINDLKVDVSYPFILQAYQDFIEEKISKNEFLDLLKIVESYVFRRAICGVPTNSLNKTFANLYKKIDKSIFIPSLKALMIIEKSYRRFPDDDEFKRELKIKDTYNFRNRNYLLRKLENCNRKEIVDVESYTIEHIMPQNSNLSKDWKQELGDNWKEIQKEYLHTIGNLTLTGYNPEYQDKSFLEKRELKDKNGLPIGFKDSPIRLNRHLAKLDHWNEDEIKNRAEAISELAISVWTYPIVEEGILNKYLKDEKKEEESTRSPYDFSQLIEGKPMRPIFTLLQKKILNIDSSVRETLTKHYISYKSVSTFVDIVPQKNNLVLILNIPFEKIKDPLGKARDISEIGSWGVGDTEIKVNNFEDVEYSFGLIKQAFYNVTESENGTY